METIAWSDMTAAGIDTDRVNKIENEADTSIPTWEAISADGTNRIVFGICLDVEGVVPEGEHTGWDAAWYYRDEWDAQNNEPSWGYSSNNYYEPENVAELLADVAKIAPRQ